MDHSDCDDSRDWVNPAGSEVCDDLNVDEDCSGAADDADPNVDKDTWVVWYVDDDGDGAGSEQHQRLACDPAPGWADNLSDCDDSDPDVNLGNCTWRSVTSGHFHTCAIDRNYEVHCWGLVTNFKGSDLHFQNDDKSHFRIDGEYSEVWASTFPSYAACGLELTSGKIDCWANPETGLEEPPEGEFVLMDLGGDFACALSIDNSIKCWGNDALDPPDIQGNVVDLQGGPNKFCALFVDGGHQCWSNGEDSVSLPGSNYVHVEPAGDFGPVCGLDTDGKIECAGDAEEYAVVKNVPINTPYSRLSVGHSDALAIRSDGSLECWGGGLYKHCNDIDGELLTGPDDWIDLEMGCTHIVGLHTDGEIYYAGPCPASEFLTYTECETPDLIFE
jgi:hypothetical protein